MGQFISGILLMGGCGKRFGSGLPKQFHRLSGKKVYEHTLERFVNSRLFDEIILVCPEEWMGEVPSESDCAIKVVKGGATRQESSYLGLLACDERTDVVVIHDAVRPFVSQEILIANVEKALEHGAVDTCITSTDTIVHSPSGKKIAHIPARSEYFRGQTPQSFQYPLILEAHRRALSIGLLNSSDDCKLVVDMGKEVYLVEGAEKNIKITTELDLFLAEQLFRLDRTTPFSDMKGTLKGKKFAVTGGTGGIGKAICDLLRQEEAEVVIISKSSHEYPADLTSYTHAEQVFSNVGPVDGLINTLGLFKMGDIYELSSQEIEELLDVNLKGLIFCCKCAQVKEGGHILNIASSSYSRGRKGFAVYSGAKAAVVNFTQGLAEELPSLNINALAPQRTATGMRHASFPDEDASSLLQPIDVAKAVVDILKQDKLTGTIIEVRK